jgi:glucose/arabinose dehydrogenase
MTRRAADRARRSAHERHCLQGGAATRRTGAARGKRLLYWVDVRGAIVSPVAAALTVAALALGGCGATQSGTRVASSASPAGGHASASAPAAAAPRATASRAKVRYARVTLKVPAANRGFGAAQAMTLPRGWTAEVWARVPAARMEAWTPQGALLVSEPGEGEITELVPGADRASPPVARTLVSGLHNPQGMAFDKVGGQEVLYVAESDELERYVWNGGSAGARTVLAGGLPDGGAHPLKNVTVGRDHTVYVDIGSATNASPPSGGGTPRASVLAYRPDGRLERVFATGIRNGDGLSIAPDGSLWTAVNQRDQIAYPFHRAYGGAGDAYGQAMRAYVNDHPPDEVARLTAGRNLGWPYCDPDPDVHPGVASSAKDYGDMRFDDDVQTNAGGKQLDCAKLARVQRGIPAHSAPLGFHFLAGSKLPSQWRSGAVVAVHGSWDRTPPRAPAVLWLPWNAKLRTLGQAITLVGGFQRSDGTRWGRSVDAVPGPDGALYVSDDTEGAVYRIVPGRG